MQCTDTAFVVGRRPCFNNPRILIGSNRRDSQNGHAIADLTIPSCKHLSHCYNYKEFRSFNLISAPSLASEKIIRHNFLFVASSSLHHQETPHIMSNTSNVFTPLLGNIKRKHTDTPATLASLAKSMPGQNEHTERHSKLGDYLGDAILGFADGLTVPFALTAGLSAYANQFVIFCIKLIKNRVGSIRVVIVGGLAELFAGAISMGLGAWLAAESDRKSYYVEEARERQEVEDCPDKEEEEIYEIFDQYHISRDASRGVVEALKVNKDCWVQVSFLPSLSLIPEYVFLTDQTLKSSN